MTSDETTKAVIDLEQYLTTVWDVRKLFHIATNFYCLDGDTSQSDEVHRAATVHNSNGLDQHLFAAYRSATERIAAVLPEIVKQPGAEVLIERLSHRIHGLVPQEILQYSWGNLQQERLDAYLDPELIEQNVLLTLLGIDIKEQPDRAVLTIADAIWKFVHPDVVYYIGKVAAVVDQYRSGITERVTVEPSPNLERIRWIGSAALFAQLIHELAAAGRIAPPQRGDADNWTGAARTLYAAFEFRKTNDEPVKFSTLDAALKPEGDRDIKGGKAAFKIYPLK